MSEASLALHLLSPLTPQINGEKMTLSPLIQRQQNVSVDLFSMNQSYRRKMNNKNELVTSSQEQQFAEVVDIIVQHRSKALRAVNEELLLTAWHVGRYVSAKLKSEEWGSKVVTQLSEYIRSQRPDIKGFGRSSIYNMVLFYDEYSSGAFSATVEKYLNSEFVQPRIGQIEAPQSTQEVAVIVPPETAKTI